MRDRDIRRLVVAVVALLGFGCAPKVTTQQALVEEAFAVCQPQGPSARLERVERDGKFSVVGREAEAKRVHDCMVRYGQPSTPTTARAATPTKNTTPVKNTTSTKAAPAKAQPLAAGRLPGTWQGTLKQRSSSEPEASSPATVRFLLSGGTLRWTLATNSGTSPVSADGSAVVVEGELRMTGTVRAARPTSVRYAGALVGDRLEVTGVTADKQVHHLSIRRVTE